MTRLRRKTWTRDYLRRQEHVVLEPEKYRGSWHRFFGNDRPIHAEFGMGKGRFIIENSKQNPEINYIGIDMYDELLRMASEKATGKAGGQQDGEQTKSVPGNLVFVLHNISEIETIFAPGELERIYLNFSDPWPKKRHVKRRLTHPDFLRKYRTILSDQGELHMKTDSRLLFEYSLNAFADEGLRMRNISLDLHRDGTPEGHVFTEYEQKFVEQGLPIYRCEVLAGADKTVAHLDCKQSSNG